MKHIKKIYYIFVFAIIINLMSFTKINVKAFDTDALYPTSQMTYYVESKENIIYYDIESDSFEIAYLEMGLFTIYKGEQYPLTRGYIIRNDQEIFYSDPNSDEYPFSMFSDDLAIIFTSNHDWYCFLYDYEEYQYAYYNKLENNYFLVDIEFDYDFYSFERNYQLYSKQFDGDVSTKITHSDYFENLKDNIGINETGSCAYVSLGILLGYYDIFVNDNIIENDEMYLSGAASKNEIEGYTEETFIKSETINNSFNIENCLESPGTTNAFHNFLLYEIGRNHFNYHDNNAPKTSCDGVNVYEIINVLDYYLSSYRNFNHNDYNIEFYSNENQIINALDNNIPVFLSCYSWSKDFVFTYSSGTGYTNENVIDTYLNAGHALVAYGYEVTNDGVFFKCHAGWASDTYNDYSDEIILSFGNDEIDAFSINFNMQHICSDAYINNISSENQHFCGGCGNLTNEYDIHCRTSPIQDTVSLSGGKKIFLELNVDCSIQYDIDSESSKELIMKIFDENMNLIETGLTTSYNQKHFAFSCPLLDKGKFYVEIYFEDSTYSGDIDIDIRPHTSTDDYISTDDEVDVLTHLHENKNEFIVSPSKSGLFLLELFAEVDGEYINPNGEFIIKNSSGEIVQKMNLSEYNHPAESIVNANNIMFYANQWGGYTIYLEVADFEYDELILKVNEVEDFTVYDMDEDDKYINNSSIQIGDFAYIYNLERIGTYNISFEYQGTQSDEMLFVLFETNEQGEYVYKDSYEINNSNSSIELVEVVTDSKNLLLCVFDSEGLGNLSIDISKELNNEFTIYGASDPSASLIYLTKGFQEICYLGADAPNPTSRYTYYNWYSTNESVINVSAYGTVTAVGVGEAKVQCVYKYDTSVVATLDFVVISDPLDNGDNANDIYLNYGFDVRTGGTISGTEVTSGKGATISVSYNPYVSIHVTYTRLICLGSDSPNSSVQSFNWRAYREEDDTGMVNVSQFGTITGVTSGWVTVEGTYKYNSRYKIKIRIYVESNI